MVLNFKFFLKTIKKKIKKYAVEIILLSTALILTVISLALFFNEREKEDEQASLITTKQNNFSFDKKIYVDIAGAVEKPDVYQVTAGARLKDILIKAGGLSAQADRNFFYRNFNLARILNDQDKIYIPSIYEINSGLFIENQRTLDYTQANVLGEQTQIKEVNEDNNLININKAPMEELDQLPGIGKVIAKKIIDNRPYQQIDDLLNKKVIGKSTFEKIKDLITF